MNISFYLSLLKGLILTYIFFLSACFSYAQSSENYFQILFKLTNDSPLKEWVQIEKTEHKPCQEKYYKPTLLINELSSHGIGFDNEKEWTKWLDYFCKNKNNTLLLIALSEVYFPYTDSLLKVNKLPYLFRYLPIALSGMNTKADWKSGAGLWHLYIPYIVKSGLIISPHYDQRLDPSKSAVTAVKRLQQLYNKNNSIKNTLLDYTFGPFPDRNHTGAYNEKDFLEAFTAIVYLFEHKKTLDFPITKHVPPKTKQFLVTDTIYLSKEKLPFNIHSIAILNPAHTTGYYNQGDTIKVLEEDAEEFTKWMENFDANQQQKSISSEKFFHKVKSGDTLSGIAYKHGVAIKEIMDWNNLNSSRIFQGQELIIFKK